MSTRATVFANLEDSLALPKDSVVKGAKHYVIPGGHFTGSGANPDANRQYVKNLKDNFTAYKAKVTQRKNAIRKRADQAKASKHYQTRAQNKKAA